AGVLGTENAVVMLAPHHLGPRGAARELVHILRDRVLAQLGRHVFRVESFAEQAPRGALVGARPNAAGRDAHADVLGVAGVDQHRGEARLLAAGDAVPLLPLGHAPERLAERPGEAAVVGAEETPGHGAGPEAAGPAAGLERPDLAERPGMRIVARVLG